MRREVFLSLLTTFFFSMTGIVYAIEVSCTVITSDELAFNYDHMAATFEGNVLIEDPDIRMKADKMLVLFEGTNQVRSVTATGNVKFWQGNRNATCNRAIYVSKLGKVILTGQATLTQGKDSVAGNEITLLLHDNSMKVTSAKLVLFEEKIKSKKTLFDSRALKKAKRPYSKDR